MYAGGLKDSAIVLQIGTISIIRSRIMKIVMMMLNTLSAAVALTATLLYVFFLAMPCLLRTVSFQ